MTHSSEKFCLKWNDFQHNITSSFKELRSDTEFADITLACEENQQIDAHKIVLTACSPFFRTILKGNKHSHPLIYMRGLKACDLVAILDFIYQGEANIFQEDLDGFLALAEEFQLKGLTGSQSEHFDDKGETAKKPQKLKPNVIETPEHELQSFTSASNDIHIDDSFDDDDTKSLKVNSLVPFHAGSMNVSGMLTKEDLNAKIMSLVERVNDGISNLRCRVCGKTTKVGSSIQDMKRHTETHLEGASYPCNQCGKVSRSSNVLKHHIAAFHRK